jgi:hypothetical protein
MPPAQGKDESPGRRVPGLSRKPLATRPKLSVEMFTNPLTDANDAT